MMVWRNSSKYVASKVNQVDFWHKPFGCVIAAHCCNANHTCCQSQAHSVSLLILVFILGRLLFSSCFCSPFVVNSTHGSLQHFNLPSLKAAVLNVSPPWLCSVDSATPLWLRGTKALGASSTSATKFPQPGETAVANPILLQSTHTQNTCTQIHAHIDVCLGLAVIFILYFWEKDAVVLLRERHLIRGARIS